MPVPVMMRTILSSGENWIFSEVLRRPARVVADAGRQKIPSSSASSFCAARISWSLTEMICPPKSRIFLRMIFPPGDPVQPEKFEQFTEIRDSWMDKLLSD